jgi:hypothetical protein
LGDGAGGLRWKDIYLSGNLDDGAGNQCNIQVACTDNVGDTIPAGMLAPFYLTVCPSGWTLADGTASTPNLTGRFVLANSSTYTVNTSGGSTSYTPAGGINLHIVTKTPAKPGLPPDPAPILTVDGHTFTGTPATIMMPYYSTIWCMKT